MRHVSPLHALIRILSVFLFCAACSGCREETGAAAAVTRIVPQPLGNAVAPPVAQSAARAAPDASAVRPQISIDPVYTVLQIVSANLDQDVEDEQVIVVKRVADVGSPVRILVADAEPGQGIYYYLSWDSDTNAVDTHILSLSVDDLVGDHTVQIIVRGVEESGRSTLDVFHPTPPSQGKGLTYRPICQVVADDISIDESDRPDSYSADLQPGRPFPIVVYLRDPESLSVMDLVGMRYTWNQAEGRYSAGAVEKIPGEGVQQAQLDALYHSPGEAPFEQFIAGSWVQVQPALKSGENDTYLSIIDFDPRGRKIAISAGNTEEVYLWKTSHRSIFKSLEMRGENETVPQIKLTRYFYVSADAMNSITVSIRSDDVIEQTTTSYQRVTDDIRSKLLARPQAQVGVLPVVLDGTFTGPSGVSVSFDAGRLTWADGSGSRSGSYVLFSLGSEILMTTRIPTPGTRADRISSWLVDFSEKKDSAHVMRQLILSPVRLTVSGYEDANGDDITMAQTMNNKK